MTDGERDNPETEKVKIGLKAKIESLLFVAAEPVAIDRLVAVLEADRDEVETALQVLAAEYVERGIRLQRKGQRVQMVTAPDAADLVRIFLGLELSGRLSPAALETLAIVAYRQPVTRAEIEAVRGVNSDSVLRTLLHRGLIEEQDRLDQPGRPFVYGTTFEFLQQFGLASLEQLPPLTRPDTE
ncbi:MAG: SMC-Scp complex subunit ScpB [Anaerolineae bacterium]|jgi:segregation and condensation protein B